MKLILFYFSVCLLLNIIQCIKVIGSKRITLPGTTPTKPTKTANEDFDVQDFLHSYGYDQGKDDHQKVLKSKFKSFTDRNSDPEFKKMIKLFQSLNKLPATGILDAKTEEKMKAPRCGVPDLVHNKTFKNFVAVTKWRKTDLTYKIINFTPDLGERLTRESIKAAFKLWEDVTPLRFTEVPSNSKSDFVIEFATRNHGDSFPFDGKGSVLAHAFFPENGRVHFDEDELFTLSDKGVNLIIVAAHEFGHAIGLDHSFDETALMAPFYRFTPEIKLTEDDILGAQQLYGKATRTSERPATTTTTTTTESIRTTTTPFPRFTRTRFTTATTTTATSINRRFLPTFPPSYMLPCAELNEAVFYDGPNRVCSLIDHDDVWCHDLRRREWEREIFYSVYPDIESGVRGGTLDNRNNTWFFKGRRAWAYNRNRLLRGFPVQITDPLFPPNPYTSINKGGEFYLLKGNLAFKFDTNTLSIVEYPTLVDQLLPGAPLWAEASIKFDGSLYIFKDKYVYKYNDATGRLESGFPKLKHEAWPPCSKYTTYASDLKALKKANTQTVQKPKPSKKT